MGVARVFSLKILSLIIVCVVVCCVLYQYLASPARVGGGAKPGFRRQSPIRRRSSAENVGVGSLSTNNNHLSELDNAAYDLDTKPQEEKEEKSNGDRDDAGEETDDDEDEDVVNVAMIFTKAQGNVVLKQKFIQSLSSMVVPHDADEVAKKTEPLIGEMLKYFIYKPGAYYSDTLFFFSIVLHKIFPLDKIILLDVDIKFKSDIQELYRHFGRFKPENVIGIAREQQPVYRHVFHLYRKEHPETKVGDPPPDGLTGFNSAVLLLYLQRMRESVTYINYLNATVVASLVSKYKFQGHLGDQDFFTLVSLEKPNLFYTLPCGWNRQLCVWWKGHGYEDVFDRYHNCDQPVRILHGNCNTIIPEQ